MIHTVELTKKEAKLLDTMPKDIAISVMLSLAINLIRASRGEFKGTDMPDNPVKLIAEISAVIMLREIVEWAKRNGEKTPNKPEMH